MKVLILDGYNLIYRARYSFGGKGEYATTFSFFRSLRPLVEKFDPDKVYFVLEGYPKWRYELHPEYKGTRPKDKDDLFHKNKRQIISILKEDFPISVIRHPEFECDDVIAHLVRESHPTDNCVVISTDTDFIQLYNTNDNVKLYNPIKKKFVPTPFFDYVKWKALKGDDSDNIDGIPQIGSKRAVDLVTDDGRLEAFLAENVDRRAKFEKNYRLIKFAKITSDNLFETFVRSSSWEKIREKFNKLEFKSITNEKSWIKFQRTFAKLGKRCYNKQ